MKQFNLKNLDREKVELEKQLDKVIDNISEKAKTQPRYILCDGVILPVLEKVLNRIPDNYRVIDVMISTAQTRTSNLSLKKQQVINVTIGNPVLEIIKN